MANRKDNSRNEQGNLFDHAQQEPARAETHIREERISESRPSGQQDIGVGSNNMATTSKRDLKSVLNDIRKVIGPWESVTQIKPGTTDTVSELEKALKRVPSGSVISNALDELNAELSEILTAAISERDKASIRAINSFVSDVAQSGISVRETADGSRIGELELITKSGQVKFQYNRIPLQSKWLTPKNKSDISSLWNESKAALKKIRIEASVLPGLFWETYEQCRNTSTSSASERGVMIQDFYKEFRVTHVRHELNRKADRTLTLPDFPWWAFLYNLDLYMSQSASLEPRMRISLEFGSQAETTKFGCVTNGLNSQQDYKKHVYLVRLQK